MSSTDGNGIININTHHLSNEERDQFVKVIQNSLNGEEDLSIDDSITKKVQQTLENQYNIKDVLNGKQQLDKDGVVNYDLNSTKSILEIIDAQKTDGDEIIQGQKKGIMKDKRVGQIQAEEQARTVS